MVKNLGAGGGQVVNLGIVPGGAGTSPCSKIMFECLAAFNATGTCSSPYSGMMETWSGYSGSYITCRVQTCTDASTCSTWKCG